MKDNKTYKPADNYESLRIQFNALQNLFNAVEKEIRLLRDKDYRFSAEKVTQLEEELHSEREMNHRLTDMIMDLEDKLTEIKSDYQKES